MTTWNDVIKSFNKETAVGSYANPERFASIFDMWLTWSDTFDSRMEKYFIPEATWMCTDTQVGLAVYLLDGEMVAVSSQNARKSDEEIQFLTVNDAIKVRKFLQELNAADTEDELPVMLGEYIIHESWFKS